MVMRRKYETTIRSSGWSRSVKITGCLRLRGKPIPHWPMVRCPSMSSMWANDPKRMSPFESRTPSLSEGCNAMSVQRNDIPCSRHTSWLQYRLLLGILPLGISRLWALHTGTNRVHPGRTSCKRTELQPNQRAGALGPTRICLWSGRDSSKYIAAAGRHCFQARRPNNVGEYRRSKAYDKSIR